MDPGQQAPRIFFLQHHRAPAQPSREVKACPLDLASSVGRSGWRPHLCATLGLGESDLAPVSSLVSGPPPESGCRGLTGRSGPRTLTQGL